MKQSRNFPDFVEAMEEAAQGIGIPPAYVRWGAIWAVGTAMGRNVYSINTRGTVYPNLYVLMVGPPGTGKSELEDLVRPFIADVGVHLAAQHVSKAALIDELQEGRAIKTFGKKAMLDYHHTAVISSEFIETFPAYDIHLLGMLARWWDCPNAVREKKRHLKDPINIHKVCANMVTGIQPAVLAHSFPSEAWNGGFLARTIFVYVPQKVELMLRARRGSNTLTHGQKVPGGVRQKLAQDLESISQLHGEMPEDEGFVDEYIRWKEGEEKPRPAHPKLQFYNGRREHQLEKLAMISAASRGSMEREGQDYLRARTWLEDTESNLDEIFLEMNRGDDMELMLDMHNFIMRKAKGCNIPVREQLVRRYLSAKIPSQRQDSFIAVAESAGFIQIHHKAAGVRTISARPSDGMEDV